VSTPRKLSTVLNTFDLTDSFDIPPALYMAVVKTADAPIPTEQKMLNRSIHVFNVLFIVVM
jgi:hypothetical protein